MFHYYCFQFNSPETSKPCGLNTFDAISPVREGAEQMLTI